MHPIADPRRPHPTGPGVAPGRRRATSRRRPLTLSVVAIGALTGSTVLGIADAPAAHAGWQNLDGRVLDVVSACRDGIRFEAGLEVFNDSPATSDYATEFIMARSAPVDGNPWSTVDVVARKAIVIPRLPALVTLPRGAPSTATVTLSNRGRYLVPVAAARRPLARGPAAVTLGNSTPNHVSVTIGDCFLYAPIDIVPGRGHNQVRIGRGEVTVALKSTPYLRADRLDRRTFRFGPKKAVPLRHRMVDIDRDGRRDLVMTFRTSKTGLTCTSTTAALVGKTLSGGRLEGRDKVTPVGCPR
ncbi:hypothetical protein [Mobilicoccus caccae]|uniref:VCBS repeat-containing protein n=1 Tax=Mobilicoccus caccae TaxID=1859295 RepID=A0ABQ6IQ58_9MICO|nr:hypothetical protein [Mobilicoccus caccae]GMA40030.1 hypothetical protein GCM10025883_20750 [Mobilicoccus caccae]